MTEPRQHRVIVAQLAGLGSLALHGMALTGVELACAVAINPEQPYSEAMRTPQVIAELGRLTAAALRAKEDAELAYRIWRDSLVHKLTNDVGAAKAAGFECACNPGKDAKGNEKEPKTPSKDAAEVYTRTLPEYRQHYDAQHAAEETWAACYAALEAAKSRQWAVRMKEDSGGNQTGLAAEPAEPGPTWDPHAGSAPPVIVAAAQATPVIPPPPPTLPAGPPPPPVIPRSDNDVQGDSGMKKAKRPPPPPPPTT